MRKKEKKSVITCAIDESLKERIDEYLQETGATTAEFTRRAIRNYVDDGEDDAVMMLYVIQLLQHVNELKDIIPSTKYERIQRCAGSIMKVKGGQ